MTIIIDNKSGVPIYDQIYSQIKAQIIGDSLRQDEALPSIRSLAKDLRISVITTKRAYDELEAEASYIRSPARAALSRRKTRSCCGRKTCAALKSTCAKFLHSPCRAA